MGAVTSVWVQCVKHTSRSTHMPSATEAMAVQEARWHAESTALRRSLAEAKQQQLHEQTAAWQAGATAALAVPADEAVACYEIQVVTGSQPDAGTTAHVYLELCGAGGSSGEHRLMYREGGRMAFATGATDAFRLHCRPLGPLIKVRDGGWVGTREGLGCLACQPPTELTASDPADPPYCPSAGTRVPQQRRHCARLVPGGGAGAAPGRRRTLDCLPLRSLAGSAPG